MGRKRSRKGMREIRGKKKWKRNQTDGKKRSRRGMRQMGEKEAEDK